MSEIVIKPAEGTPEEAGHFAELMRISAPEFFPDLLGKKFRKFFVGAFLEKDNLFSHKHVVFARFKGKIAGMLLSYDWKAKNEEKGNTGWLMMKILGFDFLRQLPAFISSISGSGRLEKGGDYISNIAVYPDFRGRKIGKALMLKAEELARESKAKKLALDVEVDNEVAITVYKKLGYTIEREHEIELEGKKYRFYRMVKPF